MRPVRIAFERVICDQTADASVREADVESSDRPLETLREYPSREMETIWIEP